MNFSVPTIPDEDNCWQAVVDRDESMIGRFILAVITTGIYCRPGCPARTPKRENVRFFPSMAAARAAGFRACKRCHPDDFPMVIDHNRFDDVNPGSNPKALSRNTLLPESTLSAIAEICRRVDTEATLPTARSLAQQMGWSEQHLARQFKTLTGMTLKSYSKASRAERLQQVLANAGKDSPITAALYEAGYASSSRFYAEADQTLGMPPRQFRAGGADETIYYHITGCPLGLLLIASTTLGVCTIALADTEAALQETLRERFPAAHLVADDHDYHQAIEKTLAYLEHPSASLDLPLDVQGTAFQRRVWFALQQIPVGETVSYRDVAEHLGQPTASRAVATACAANKVALAIPCHRVVRQGGKISGYRWGVERKQRLIAKEAEHAQSDLEEKTQHRDTP